MPYLARWSRSFSLAADEPSALNFVWLINAVVAPVIGSTCIRSESAER